MAKLLRIIPVFSLCYSLVSLAGDSGLDADVCSLPPDSESQDDCGLIEPSDSESHDDCSLMQLSDMKAVKVGINEGTSPQKHGKRAWSDKLQLTQYLQHADRDELMYKAMTGMTSGDPALLFGLVYLIGCGAICLLHSNHVLRSAFHSMPLLSSLSLLCLLVTFCWTMLPVLWHSAGHVIRQSGVLVLLSTYIAILVLMMTPLILIRPDQETSQRLASYVFGAREQEKVPREDATGFSLSKLLARCLLDESEQELVEERDERGFLLFVTFCVSQVSSSISVFKVAGVIGEPVQFLILLLYGLLVWFSLCVLYEAMCPDSSTAANTELQDAKSEDVHSVGFIEEVGAMTAVIDNNTFGLYMHCSLWGGYGAFASVISVCLGVQICHAIFASFGWYLALLWTMIIFWEVFLLFVMLIEIIICESAFGNGGWLWRAGKRLCGPMFFLGSCYFLGKAASQLWVLISGN
mmetsp:Transcript_95751/g.175287  ORF Transcript_95751/g.175287 Transcript_95751/m.175287 type:complete len:464 (-) Transcript_95751:151-1542(-)